MSPMLAKQVNLCLVMPLYSLFNFKYGSQHLTG
jgi:hypothetical protein